MNLRIEGVNSFTLSELTREELKALSFAVQSANLPEKRTLYKMKDLIDKTLQA